MSCEYISDRFVFTADCDWLQLRHWRNWNWIMLRLLQLEPEWDRGLGSVRLSVALAGFHAYASYNYNPHTPKREELREMLDSLSGAHVSVPCEVWWQTKADADAFRAMAPVESLGREHGE